MAPAWLLLLGLGCVRDTDDSAQISCELGQATLPEGPWLVDVTEAALPTGVTTGFGRPTVVDLDGDGLDDLVATPAQDGLHPEPPGDYDKLVLRNRGDGTFEDFTETSGLDQARVGLLVFGDVDDDGDQDAFAGITGATGEEHAGIWLNDGTGRFSRLGSAGTGVELLDCEGSPCTADQITATFADLDGDGVLDLYVGAWLKTDASNERYFPPGQDSLYRGLGDGRFEDLSHTLPDQQHPWSPEGSGRAAMGLAPGDYDGDGDTDLFVADHSTGRPVGPNPDHPVCLPPHYWDWNLLWRNDGGMVFTDVGEAAGVHATLRGPEGVQEEAPLVLGGECPEEVRGAYPSPIGGNHFTPHAGDFDNDGDLDLVVGAISHADYPQSDPTLLFVNQGDGSFTEEGLARGLAWREDEKQVHWVDLDGDGRLDLATTGDRDEDSNDWRLYHQQPDQSFALVPASTLGVDHRQQEGMAWLDYDDDGDLDLYLAEDQGEAHLFENLAGDANRWLGLRLEARAPADATGARVSLTGAGLDQVREVTGGHGHYNPQDSRRLVFGLGGDTCAADVRVRWPDGEVQELGDLPAGSAWRLVQGEEPEGG